jgi:predicted phage tail protein
MMRKVYLEGDIGEKFGKEFTMDASSFQEVVKCLDCNFPELREYLINSAEKGVEFVCEVEDTPITHESELLLHYDTGAMTIRAIPAGSEGIAKAIVGMFIVALLFIPGMQAFGAAAGKTLFATVMAGGASGLAIGTALGLAVLGGSLLMQGLTEMMMPDPAVDNGGASKEDTYLFQGAGQVIVEGDPVPVLYGQLRVGGRPISFQTANAAAVFVHREPLNATTPDNNNSNEEGTDNYNGNTDGNNGGGTDGGGDGIDTHPAVPPSGPQWDPLYVPEFK